jgi:hypothetical protein
MRGVITDRDVVSNLGLIWREFGTVCMVKCLMAFVTRRRTTFLHVAMGAADPVREPNR